ncbi:hypothetical protein BOO71_0014776 [Deinococcus marmoris]|uniref:Uncharacterized protein n=1 Tax=Deinococcus marmoris TaxID=249408 RepID=A0A1U7NRG2_9DEIO|nr:hypothetical protein BOO71_0014776 [Deinococcus marmoris]
MQVVGAWGWSRAIRHTGEYKRRSGWNRVCGLAFISRPGRGPILRP